MTLPDRYSRRHMPNLFHCMYSRTSVDEAEPSPCQDLPIALRVELLTQAGKIQLLVINQKRSEGLMLRSVIGKI